MKKFVIHLKKNKSLLTFLKLQFGIIVFSFGPIISNFASNFEFSDYRFQISYVVIIIILVFYYYIWQATLKHMPLSIAYSYRSSILIWNLLWAYFFADQTITFSNITGTFLILSGILIIKK